MMASQNRQLQPCAIVSKTLSLPARLSQPYSRLSQASCLRSLRVYGMAERDKSYDKLWNNIWEAGLEPGQVCALLYCERVTLKWQRRLSKSTEPHTLCKPAFDFWLHLTPAALPLGF